MDFQMPASPMMWVALMSSISTVIFCILMMDAVEPARSRIKIAFLGSLATFVISTYLGFF